MTFLKFGDQKYHYTIRNFTQVPLTTDHRVVQDGLDALETGRVEGGTAIGMGLATAVNRLRKSDAKSKVVILITDGENNAGQIEPQDAAQLARLESIALSDAMLTLVSAGGVLSISTALASVVAVTDVPALLAKSANVITILHVPSDTADATTA